MKLEINQQNLHLILPGKLSWMAEMYIEDHKTSVVEALRAIYKSPTYANLEQESSKLWEYGPVALYEVLNEDSLEKGR
ncbi:MAG: hypothetical protein HUK15_05850 [Bacteroidales bacterium]|nr:hypothetical protein [Bacteroidales bacterium]